MKRILSVVLIVLLTILICSMVVFVSRHGITEVVVEEPGKLRARPEVTSEVIPSTIRSSPPEIQKSSDSRPAALHNGWSSSVLMATDKITFQKMQASGPSGSTAFWYPVEETLHSADYIESQERNVVNFWMEMIRRRQNSMKSCNVLDIGANGGYFALLSRSLGCNVLAVDPQPWCLTRLSSAAAVNGYFDRIGTRWTAVSDSPDLTIDVGATKCSGLWAVKGSDWINKESSSTTAVKSSTCDDIVSSWLPDQNEQIVLMKIDAEGSEISIIRSARKLIESKRIIHIVLELVPGRVKDITPYENVCETLDLLYSNGYRCTLELDPLVEGNFRPVGELKSLLDPNSRAKGRGNPSMWRCSLDGA